jgi:biofilm PGA synthesis lipoprotein PgaB
VNTVFIRMFHNQGDRPLFKGGPSAGSGVYFRTEAAPMLKDYLSEIIPLCRRLGLSIFAWMTTRRSEWLLSEDPGLAEYTYDPPTDRVLRSRSLNIFHPRVVERLALLYRDLAAYDIDGILFQDDLVLRAGEGFSPEAIAAYMEDGGPTVSPGTLFRLEGRNPGSPLFSPDNYRPAFWDWVAWKNRRLLELAWELMDAAREIRPGLRFALNLYYEAVLNPRMALAWYAQDLKAAQGYPFDYYSLMSYHRQIGKELSLSGEEALGVLTTMSRRAVRAVGSPEKIIMKIQALDWDTRQTIPREELDHALEAATPVEGISLAFVRSRSDPPLDVIRKHFLIRK